MSGQVQNGCQQSRIRKWLGLEKDSPKVLEKKKELALITAIVAAVLVTSLILLSRHTTQVINRTDWVGNTYQYNVLSARGMLGFMGLIGGLIGGGVLIAKAVDELSAAQKRQVALNVERYPL